MSKTTTPYVPRPGSLAWRVITWLQANPGEELTRPDVAASSVGGCLLHAKQHGGLITATNADGQRVYRLPDLITEEAAA